ncbi:MAG: hypothetical protein WA775_12290 [Psychroserpens sp.]|uniref:hypothetical protein n=1 Tax=Psychroserpens sp. TaxID=2020870 RepID=UPI003C772AC7
MKKYGLIISLIAFVFLLNCDRRTSKKERLEHAIAQFKSTLELTDHYTYYPEGYLEVQTDSLIANQFQVHIKNYSILDSEILMNQSVKAHKKTIQFHRRFESDVLISVANEIIFEKHITAEHFKDKYPNTFLQNATLEHVWVNQENSNSEKLTLGISFINPINKAYQLYEMRIDAKGNEQLTLLEDHS